MPPHHHQRKNLLHRAPRHRHPALRDSVAAPHDAILAHQGEIVQPIGADAPEITARFRDPAGNIIGLYQEPK
jgi:predicted enzyme related to lactoylglutathione lyase